jgi:muramoyltetrapeptide carboxypeptidase LdcA involved in peptidoglycan recycling
VDFRLIAAAGKPFFGFSNACVLLNGIAKKTELTAYYGPESLNRFALSDQLVDEFLRPATHDVEWASADSITIVPGVAKGRMFGGNLSSFAKWVHRTEYEPDWEERIFVWESGATDLRIVDTQLRALLRAGFGERISGMVLGTVGGGDGVPLDSTLLGTLQEFGKPVLYLPAFGHYRTRNVIVPIGGYAVVNATGGTVLVT